MAKGCKRIREASEIRNDCVTKRLKVITSECDFFLSYEQSELQEVHHFQSAQMPPKVRENNSAFRRIWQSTRVCYSFWLSRTSTSKSCRLTECELHHLWQKVIQKGGWKISNIGVKSCHFIFRGSQESRITSSVGFVISRTNMQFLELTCIITNNAWQTTFKGSS